MLNMYDTKIVDDTHNIHHKICVRVKLEYNPSDGAKKKTANKKYI